MLYQQLERIIETGSRIRIQKYVPFLHAVAFKTGHLSSVNEIPRCLFVISADGLNSSLLSYQWNPWP
jgi:hypothetical protein